MDRFPVEVGRARTASGWEWFLLVDGERVQTSEHRVGIFTSTAPTPQEMLPRLLAKAAKAGSA